MRQSVNPTNRNSGMFLNVGDAHMVEKYIIHLSDEERSLLESMIKVGKSAAYKIRNAHILLKSDASADKWSAAQCAKVFSCHRNTVYNLRQRFVEEGLEAALERQKKAPRPLIVDGEAEARIIALSCGPVPQGYSQWSLRLLAQKIVELNIVESISHETVRSTLKKTFSNPI
jgi:transposase